MDDVLVGLNPAQREAVQAVEGPVLVLAGPGSGKTRVLTHRIAHLIDDYGLHPYEIMAVTFTNKAAREMVTRLESLIGSDTTRLTIGTFHAICARILRHEAEHLGLSSSFVIYDADDQRRLIKRVLQDLDIDTKQYRPVRVHGAISRAKNDLVTAETYVPPSYFYEAVRRVFERYDALKFENNALDFDDLLLKTEELLRLHEDVRQRYQSRYRHILVDEFQDTNKAQYELVRWLAAEHRNVFVVGDEDQSIYSWRGADFRNVRRFQDDFTDAQVILLEQNYRSTQTILDAAQAVISRNRQRTHKTLWTDNDRGSKIQLFEAYDEREEAEHVATEIMRITRGSERSQGSTRSLSDCAVMFRTNAQSRVLEDAMVRHGIQYRLVGAIRFYQRREVKDVLAYLRLIHNPDDEISLLRVINVPTRGIGAKTVAQLQAWAASLGLSPGQGLLHLAQMAAEHRLAETPFTTRTRRLLVEFAALARKLVDAKQEMTLTDLLKHTLDESGYLAFLRDGTEEGEERINNVRELFTVTDGYVNYTPNVALARFLEDSALYSETDEIDRDADAVTMLTLHSAKGLEYNTVFMVGMEEGICPHSRALEDPDRDGNALEEERRLVYVGITRAKSQLYMTRTFRRTLYGTSETREPSSFLRDIPSELTTGNTVARSSLARRRTGASSTQSSTPELSGRDLVRKRRDLLRRTRERREAFREGSPSSRPDRPAVRRGRDVSEINSLPSRRDMAPREERLPVTQSFEPGDSVTHPIFGVGTVISSLIVNGDEEVAVAFEGRGVKRLMASFAKLTKN